MSTSNAQAKLDYIAGTKAAIKDAIVTKGVAVGSEVTFREYATKIAEISGGTYTKVVRQLTSSGTWTKPEGLTHLEVVCIGGGGAGASGSKTAADAVSRAGAGGGAASMAWGSFLASELSATEDYVVGAGGIGGVAVTTNSTIGASGTIGGDTYFSGTNFATSKVYAQGGNFAANSTAGAARSSTNLNPNSGFPGGAGTPSSPSGGGGGANLDQNTQDRFLDYNGAGTGGGITTVNAASPGGSGARYYNKSLTLSAANGGAISTDGGDGVAGYMNRLPFNIGDGHYSDITVGYGTPGGGGGSSVTGNAGRGGDGGNYGGAGGGGGSARNDVGNSGRGGNGGNGVIILIEHIVA